MAASSNNTIYRFLNDARTNWQRFTILLLADIIRDFMKLLTSEERKVTDVMVEMLHSAQCAGISAKYVLFDSWFSALKTIIVLKKQEHPLSQLM